MNRVATGLAALAAATVALAGCGSSSSGGAAAPAPTDTSTTRALIAGCTPSTIHTVTSGVLTFGVDQPVYPPWYNDNKTPLDGNGYESAVGLAIAKELGYAPSQIAISRITFNQAISPAPKHFDLDLDEFSISAAREKAVDFSSPYYNVSEAIVAMKGSKAASVTTLAGLKALRLGAQIGSTNETTITDVIKPSPSPGIYNSNAIAIQALKNGQIDGLVVDLPTAFYITAVQLSQGTIVGQLAPSASPEQFGALLAKNSPVTDCVSKAVDALTANGTLPAIQDKWLAKEAKAPVLQ